jgi:hypothetical protein
MKQQTEQQTNRHNNPYHVIQNKGGLDSHHFVFLYFSSKIFLLCSDTFMLEFYLFSAWGRCTGDCHPQENKN